VLQVQARHRDRQWQDYIGLLDRLSIMKEGYVCRTSAWRSSPLIARCESHGIALTSLGQTTDERALWPQKSSCTLCWQ
jgi:hypothetical protein